MPAHGEVRIGISGWRYKGWRGKFYPPKLPQKSELAYAASKFRTIEINGTFYSLQSPASFARWAAATPEDFQFAVKGSRYITHKLRVRDAKIALANYFASGLLLLGRKLGPILWQFPPNFVFKPDLLEEFFALLPRNSEDALKLARKHTRVVRGGRGLKVPGEFRLRHAIEIRHQSFRAPEFIRLLRRQKIALVCADSVEWPRLMDLTADFVYVRLHGSEQLYASGYDEKSLEAWARRVACWARGLEPPDAEKIVASPAPKRAKRDVYVYFDNDAKVRAPADAASLAAKVGKLLR